MEDEAAVQALNRAPSTDETNLAQMFAGTKLLLPVLPIATRMYSCISLHCVVFLCARARIRSRTLRRSLGNVNVAFEVLADMAESESLPYFPTCSHGLKCFSY